MDRVINDEIQKELQIGLYSTEDKIKDIEAGSYNIWKEWKMQDYKSKPSNINYVHYVREQYDILYPEVRIIDDMMMMMLTDVNVVDKMLLNSHQSYAIINVHVKIQATVPLSYINAEIMV
jgi:hypothetical protein